MSAIRDWTSSRCSTKFSWILVSPSSSLTQPSSCASKVARGISAAAATSMCSRTSGWICAFAASIAARLARRCAAAGLFGFRLRDRRAQQRLHQRGDQIAALERVGLDPVARQIGLHRGVDDLGELAAAQDQAALGADFAFEAGQHFSRAASRRSSWELRAAGSAIGAGAAGDRRRGHRRIRGAALRQSGDARVERALAVGPFEKAYHSERDANRRAWVRPRRGRRRVRAS